MAIGMALYGLQPVADIQFMDFIYPAFNQIVSDLAKFRYRSGAQFPADVVIRTPYGGGIKGGLYHSQSTEAYFTHTPGLVVLTSSTPYDAKGLLTAAMRSPDPVIFLEPKRLYRSFKQEVPSESYAIPIGKANLVNEGRSRHAHQLGTDGADLQRSRWNWPGRRTYESNCWISDLSYRST